MTDTRDRRAYHVKRRADANWAKRQAKLGQCPNIHPELGLPCTLDVNHDGPEGHACIVPTPGRRHPNGEPMPRDIVRWK